METKNFEDYSKFLGPYADSRPGRWRVYGVRKDTGKREVFYFASQEEAEENLRYWRREVVEPGAINIGEGLRRYEEYLRQKGNRELSIEETMRRLSGFFVVQTLPLTRLTEKICIEFNERIMSSTFSVDTKLNHLNAAKTFTRWCLEKRFISVDPMFHLRPVGRRKKGKAQLHIDEARAWIKTAEEAAVRGEAGAVAAMMSLLLGLRASEIVSRTVRDVDDNCTLLWVERNALGFEVKTDAGRRRLMIPTMLQGYLRRLVEGRKPNEYLFVGRYGRGHRNRNWVLGWVQALCIQAGVSEVTTHGMRGLNASLATQAGLAPQAVASALGHGSWSTTAAHYATKESIDTANQKASLDKLLNKPNG